MLEETLLGAIVPSAGETRQVKQYRDFGARLQGLWREIEV
jgi:hypothetical protein